MQASFVIATYGRPEVLAATLGALVLQRQPDWEAIVVGDCCDDRTETVVRDLDDPRVRYYNLPRRYGEQGGPNSVGLAVARGDLVTFLNHDDLLLPDHLDTVLAEFARGHVDVLATRTVTVRGFRAHDHGPPDITCGPRKPDRFRVPDVIGIRMYTLEPSSVWTIRRRVALRTGPWRSSQSILRLPFQDWLLRLARVTRRWRFRDQVTGIMLVGDYTRAAPEAADLVRWLATQSPDAVREILVPVPNPPAAFSRRARALYRFDALMAPVGLAVYRLTGVDYGKLTARLWHRERGQHARDLLAKRTGETMPDHSPLATYLADPEALRVR